MQENWWIIPIMALLLSLTIFNDNNYVNNVYPNNIYELNEELIIMGNNLDLYFDDNSDKILSYDEIETENTLNKTFIELNIKFNSKRKKIIIGNKNTLKRIKIVGSSIDLSGNIFAQDITIESNGMNINSNIYAKSLNINGAGINIYGNLDVQDVIIDGAGLNMTLNLSNLNSLNIDGAGIQGKVKLLNSNNANINIDAYGNLDLYYDEKINIEKNTFFELNIYNDLK